MYRYRDHHLATQQVARPWMGWAAVVFGALVLVYLGVIWGMQGRALPNATSSVGGDIELPSDIYAVAVLFNDSQKDLLFELTGVVDQTIAIRTDGTIVPGGDLSLAAPRPAGWFWPSTIGAAYIKEGDRVAIRRIADTRDGLRVPMPYVTPIQTPIHPEANFGTRCEETCDLPGVEPVGLSPVDVLKAGEDTIVSADTDQLGLLHRFAQESAKLRNPVEQVRRTADGNRVTELVPAQNMEAIAVAGDTSTFQIGGEAFSWFYRERAGIDTLIVTTIDILDDYQNSLSTETWTNKLCGRQPAVFIKQDIEPTLASESHTSLVLMRSTRDWRICLQ